MQAPNESFLSPYRFLDLTDNKGLLCGKLLADLGAEVIKVEPPGGDPDRSGPAGPFLKSENSDKTSKSLHWSVYNQGKKGITLNLDTDEGQELFMKLAARAHGVIESFHPGHMAALGLDYEALARINPAIVFTSITPFGQDGGPYANWKACDLVGMAMGGYMYLCGDADRAPVRITAPQAWLHTCGEAAVGAMIALYHAAGTGEGQHVDVSMQESVAMLMFNSRGFWELDKTVLTRQGARRSGLSSGAIQRQTWPCRDGFITFVILGAASGAKTNQGLVQWMDEEGMADDFLRGIDWNAFDMAAASQEFHDQLEARLKAFFLEHTRTELTDGAMKRRVMLYPVATVGDLMASPQLAARGYWTKVDHPETGMSITYPGPFVKCTPNALKPGRRAPLVGEHNNEIYGREVGLSSFELVALRRRGVI
ncbi:MAG: CoA transferase [Chloroflexi bacterium]|nr:CoA transferase [Chloroflexota bacterium]